MVSAINRLVILTVSYHSQEALKVLAEGLSLQTRHPFKWLIIDNSPKTAPVKLKTQLPVALISGEEGDGFALGCNRGLSELEKNGWSGWVWLLNPDTSFMDENTLEKLAHQLDELPADSLVGTAVLGPDGKLEKSAGWIDSGLNFRGRLVNDEMKLLGSKRLVAVDWVSGCSLLMRPTSHLVQTRFEVAFPLYYEDMDLCLRHSRKGMPIFWFPYVVIRHQSGDGSKVTSSKRLRLSSCSYIRFLQRHSQGWVLALRSFRLIFKAMLFFPLRPQRSFAVLQGWFEAFRRPLL